MEQKDKFILEARGITKIYPGVVALNNITMGFKEGEVHAIVGENGAGKSTLIKIFSGAEKPSSGEIYFDGEKMIDTDPRSSLELGIGVIYQEFNLFPYLTIAENLFMGKEIRSGLMLNKQEMNKKASEALQSLGIILDPAAQIRKLSVAYQQIVEICKVLAAKVRVLIMDEPTAPLTNKEVDYLFNLIRKLKSEGVCIIYISHRLEEIFKIADRVSVLRDGHYVATKDIRKTDRSELISLMVGRKIEEIYPLRECKPGEILLRAEKISSKGVLDKVSLHVRKGEILGISGLIGSGRTELARAIFGADNTEEGEIHIGNNRVNIKTPADAIKNKIGLIPEDRKRHGLILKDSIKDNISITNLKKFCRFGFIDKKKEKDVVNGFKGKLGIKTPSIDQKVKNLSGGNQQKVVLAKWLSTDLDVLIFDEPTRGIDVNAKQEIYRLMCDLAESGKAIIMISSEMPELIGMSDRIIVMCRGSVAGELDIKEVTQEKLLELAAGGQ